MLLVDKNNHWSYRVAIAPIDVFAKEKDRPCPYFHLRVEWVDYYSRVLRFKGCDNGVCLAMSDAGLFYSDYDCDNKDTHFVQQVTLIERKHTREYKYMSATHKGRYVAISPKGVLWSTNDKSSIDAIFVND